MKYTKGTAVLLALAAAAGGIASIPFVPSDIWLLFGAFGGYTLYTRTPLPALPWIAIVAVSLGAAAAVLALRRPRFSSLSLAVSIAVLVTLGSVAVQSNSPPPMMHVSGWGLPFAWLLNLHNELVGLSQWGTNLLGFMMDVGAWIFLLYGVPKVIAFALKHT